MKYPKVVVDKFFVPENSGTTKIGNYFFSIGDDTSKIFVHFKKGKKFIEFIPISIELNDAEAICKVKDFDDLGNCVLAIYTHNNILEVSLNSELKVEKTKVQEIILDKKVESIEYIPEHDIYVLADRIYKGNNSYGNGKIYYVPRDTGKLFCADLECDDKKPTDMHYRKGILYILHEDHIERFKYKKNSLKTKKLSSIKLKKRVKDVESLVVTKKNIYIFVDKKKE